MWCALYEDTGLSSCSLHVHVCTQCDCSHILREKLQLCSIDKNCVCFVVVTVSLRYIFIFVSHTHLISLLNNILTVWQMDLLDRPSIELTCLLGKYPHVNG